MASHSHHISEPCVAALETVTLVVRHGELVATREGEIEYRGRDFLR